MDRKLFWLVLGSVQVVFSNFSYARALARYPYDTVGIIYENTAKLSRGEQCSLVQQQASENAEYFCSNIYAEGHVLRIRAIGDCRANIDGRNLSLFNDEFPSARVFRYAYICTETAAKHALRKGGFLGSR